MTDQQQQMAQWLRRADNRVDDALDEVFRSIAEARTELDRIEGELHKAARGEAHRRIGEVSGVSAQAVFAAFGALESRVELRRVFAAMEEQS